jgi:hypothetical protein
MGTPGRGGFAMRRWLQRLLWGSSIAVLAAPPAWSADYRESFEETRPRQEMFEGQLLFGAADGWLGEIKKGTYFLIDQDKAGAIKLILLPRPQASPMTISVDVFGQFAGEKAGVGLAYGYESEAGGYYAFVVTANKGYALYRGSATGIELLSKGTNPVIQVGSVNRLAVELDGSTAKLLVNGQQVYAHEAAGARAPLAGRVGIIAIDKGAYSFDDFSISSSAKGSRG